MRLLIIGLCLFLALPAEAETVTASWYGRQHHGRMMANGERFDMNALTVAHRRLPFGTRVRITNLQTQESVVAVVTDRGPFTPGRQLDMSRGVAARLGLLERGVARVRMEVVR